MDLDEFLIKLKSSNESNKHGNLINSLERLSSLCETLTRLAPQHDWKDLPYNGFRSLIKLCNLFTINVLRVKCNPLIVNNDQESLINTIKLLIAMTERAVDYHRDGQEPDEGFKCDKVVKTFRDLRQHFDEIEPYLKSYWADNALFWMTPDSRWVPYYFSLVYSLVHRFPKSLLASVSNTEYANIMTFSTWKATLFFPINLANYVDNFITRTYSGLRFMVSDVEYREFMVPRQSKWIINDDGSRISSSPEDDDKFMREKKETVLCHLMRYKPHQPSGDVIIHAQGGGLVVDARQLHEEYLRDWVQQLDGSTIINIAYSRFVRYPFALQEILDVFLWLTSGDDQVDKMIGFKPKRIICLGDSAGAYLLFSLCLVARDIQLISPMDIKTFPKALVAFSPILSSASSKIFPSFLLSYIDPFLCPSLLLHCFSLYGSGVIFDSDCIDLENVNTNYQSSSKPINWSTWLTDKYTMSTSSFKNFYNTWLKKGKSWYDCDNETFEERVNQMASRITIPYISPVVSYDLETIKDLELYLISTEFDPLLDTNIELAKKWKGKLTLDVIDQMAHGFSAYYSLSNSCYQASKLCLQRLKESVSS
ncbi:uncharacterized protein LOC128395648 [Panonychus citri]|uniref:uncharacterized protein LOC128395648 n=1 Tax=Panonychus citri TaxID=50023 RepID=UPI00230706CE|nr:uncharacterized protein LOC128395648 [Panonychus citri]